MARDLDDILAKLPPKRRAKIEARAREILAEVEGLRRLRRLAARSQVEVARRLGVKQPSISKIERQTDMYLSTLRQYVEASGGRLDLVVRLPDLPPLRLTGLGDLPPAKAAPRRRRHAATA